MDGRYIAAGFTTLVCYAALAAGHYVFMRRICKTYMEGEMVYDIRILLGITAAFMALGFAFLMAYNHAVLRYALVIVLGAFAAVNYKKIIHHLRGVVVADRKIE